MGLTLELYEICDGSESAKCGISMRSVSDQYMISSSLCKISIASLCDQYWISLGSVSGFCVGSAHD